VPDRVELVQLPWVRARDLAFSALVDADDRPLDDAFRAARRERLLALFTALRPQVVITEMFPFGRRAFRFELLPLLAAAAGASPRPWVIGSVRDILVPKPAPERYSWMRDLALARYDRVLVHTDPALIPFALTFPYANDLGARLLNTGYVVEAGPPAGAGEEVLVSAGGGRVGSALVAAALAARPLSRHSGRPWRVIAGDARDDASLGARRAGLPPGLLLERQRADFQNLLAKCLLSVSQAGYNTVVEVLRLGKPMVLVPFETATETEQRIRAERLSRLGLAEIVWESELTPSSLACAIDRVASSPPEARPTLDLDGAARSARLIAELAVREAPAEPAG
jgi:predicted glycosyltransferase